MSEENNNEQEVSKVALINAAMEKWSHLPTLSQVKKAAAEELQMPFDELNRVIYQNPVLRLRWTKDEPAPPDEIDTMSRDSPISAGDMRMADAIRYENKKLKLGGELLGFDKHEKKIYEDLASFTGGRLRTVMDVTIAGVAKTFIKYLVIDDRIAARLEEVQMKILGLGGEMTEDRPFWVQEEKSLVEQIALMGGLKNKIAGIMVDSSVKLSLVEHKIKGGGMKKVKPGFQDIGGTAAET